jgi:hypothetical protein
LTKRTAYIGLSGPVCYDYKNMLNTKYPNPILEAPLGLMVLYDEVVFLNETICPKSMQDLDFIKFLSDREDIKDLFEKIDEEKMEEYRKKWQDKEFSFKGLRSIAERVAPFATWDNHSRSIEEIHNTPNSASITNVLYDNLISHDQGLPLITNSAIEECLISPMNSVLKENLVNIIVSEQIPNYLTEIDPFVETIYDIRGRPYIREFRSKIDDLIYNRDTESLNDLKTNVEKELNEITLEFTARALDKMRIYNGIGSVAKAVVPEVLKNVPGLGLGIAAYDITKDFLEILDDRKHTWAGFLVDLRRHKPTRP